MLFTLPNSQEQTKMIKAISDMKKVISKFTFLIFLLISSFLFLFANLLSPISILAQDEESTESSQSVRDKVRQTIESLAKKPKATTGTLDQITDTTLQIKNTSGKINLVATKSDTAYIRYVAGKRTDTKFADLTLGDFTVAMGYKNGNDILEAERVISYDKNPITGRSAIFGIVESVDKTVLNIKHPFKADTWKVEIAKTTAATAKVDGKQEEIDTDDIKQGDKLIVVADPNEKKQGFFVASLIHVVSGASTSNKQSTSPTPVASPKVSPKASAKPSPKPSPTP